MNKIKVTCGFTSLTPIDNKLNYAVVSNSFGWVNEGKKPSIVFQRKINGKYVFHKRFFLGLRYKPQNRRQQYYKCLQWGFSVLGRKITVPLTATAAVKENGYIDFSIKAFH